MRLLLAFLSLVTVALSGAAENPVGHATTRFELPGMDGIIEGIAYRPTTQDFFFGDVHNRCVWRRDRAGRVTRFSAADPKSFGVFGLAIDEVRHRLWAATSMVPETRGFSATDKGRAALVALDLDTGSPVGVYAAPADQRDHVLGDLCLGGDGTVYLTDSVAPVVWKLSPNGARLQVLAESSQFRSLQGIGLRPGGHALVVTDYAHGLFVIDIESGGVRAVAGPGGNVIRGLDGIVVAGDRVFAVQNGREPNSVVQLVLSPDATSVLRMDTVAAGAAAFEDLTLMTRGPSGLCVIAKSGWALANPAKGPAIPAHMVLVFDVGTSDGSDAASRP